MWGTNLHTKIGFKGMWCKGMVALEFSTTKSIHTIEYHFSLWRFKRLILDREWWDRLRPLTERSGGLVAGCDHANSLAS